LVSGFRPDSQRELTALQDTLAGFNGLFAVNKDREGREGENGQKGKRGGIILPIPLIPESATFYACLSVAGLCVFCVLVIYMDEQVNSAKTAEPFEMQFTM